MRRAPRRETGTASTKRAWSLKQRTRYRPQREPLTAIPSKTYGLVNSHVGRDLGPSTYVQLTWRCCTQIYISSCVHRGSLLTPAAGNGSRCPISFVMSWASRVRMAYPISCARAARAPCSCNHPEQQSRIILQHKAEKETLPHLLLIRGSDATDSCPLQIARSTHR